MNEWIGLIILAIVDSDKFQMFSREPEGEPLRLFARRGAAACSPLAHTCTSFSCIAT